ncbi:hypothetical protein DL766_007149 [Monosporascus sp. MC13-8B]|nr:hypothetical protein DL763_001570 [Monosporascus cannonballus]RYP25056.1 hypothetical protein DL766_007149 [Monosporascus sp. MC13-8B]
MLWGYSSLLLLLASQGLAYTWPDAKVDHLEALLYQQQQYHGSLVGSDVRWCFLTTFDLDELRAISGRLTAAEWIRVAYHDMATADVEAGTGGLDASISFETDRGENGGPAFNSTMRQLYLSHSAKSSMADLIAMSAVLAVGGCSNGKVWLDYRGGRIDATEAEPLGVPEPHQGLEEHTEIFRRQGFNQEEMIGLVACGHSVGGVHGSVFPQIVPVVEGPGNEASLHPFDSTAATFDNHVAVEFTENSTQNALAFGHNEITRSDHRIFTADGGNIISRMAQDNDFYLTTCKNLLERMIDTVPKNVELSDVIEPIVTKPDYMNIVVNEDGTLFVRGEVRTIQDEAIDRDSRQVVVHLNVGDKKVSAETTWNGESLPFHENRPSFDWWGFNATVPIAQGLSFDVEIIDGGDSKLETNGGNGFPLQTDIIPQTAKSCSSTAVKGPSTISVTAAVGISYPSRQIRTETDSIKILDEANFDSVTLSVDVPHAQQNSLVPRIEPTPVEMKKTGVLEGTGYSLYSASLDFGAAFQGLLSYDVIGRRASGDSISEFNSFDSLRHCSKIG